MNTIEVSNLSKRYRIGKLKQRNNLRDTLAALIRKPFSRNRFDTLVALDDVSFSIQEGEVVGVIGANGAGKSTLLKMLSRISYPSTGRIVTRGRVGSLLEVGTGFHEELTGRDNIFLNGAILGMKRIEILEKIDEIIAFSGVEKFIDTPIKRYSSGMKLRLGFAVAAHLETEILVVDEVLAVGDAEFQKKCIDKMEDLRSSGRTVVFVSHDMSAIETLCPRTIWIDKGKVRLDGESKKVIREYLASFNKIESSSQDLAGFANRIGTGEAQFTRIDILDDTGAPKNYIRSGDSVKIRYRYHAYEPVLHPHFGMEIRTELGVLVTELNTWAMSLSIPDFELGDGYVDVTIPKLNLIPGRYICTPWIASYGKSDYEMLPNALVLEVESADVFGGGKGLKMGEGILYFDCRWNLDGVNARR